LCVMLWYDYDGFSVSHSSIVECECNFSVCTTQSTEKWF